MMVNTAESKQHQSRHFGFKHKGLARESTAQIGKSTKRALAKKAPVVPSRHISRKDHFYGRQSRNDQQLHSVRKVPSSKTVEEKEFRREEYVLAVNCINNTNNKMHPEQVQVSEAVVEVVTEEKHILKPLEAVEDDIDVEEVDNGDLNAAANGGSKEELNGNGVHHKDNGHTLEIASQSSTEKEQVDVNPANGADFKSVTRIRSSRRNSTSSRSSSVSSAPSLKQHTPMALQMEVSLDEDEREHMEPLIIEGNAEDLEVSMSASHDDDADDGATTDSEAILEAAHDPYEFDEEIETEMLSKRAKNKSSRASKNVKSPKSKSESKVNKPKTPRSKSLKLKTTKPSPRLADKIFEEMDTENSDTNSLYKDDTESEDLNTKRLSPPKRSKTSPSKQDLVDDAEIDDKESESEHVPRRSSRSRQTPQKYNSSVYMDSVWEHQLLGEDRMNNSDAQGASSIRSVKGRRSLRKSRNISALNTSLHNESSPWDSEFKVLTPCGGGLSVHNETVESIVESTTPLKRKASDDDDNEEHNERGQKKMCVENTDLDNSTASQTSSFFSVITSPIVMLKNKFRRSSVNCSTPIKESIVTPLEPEVPASADIGDDVGPVPVPVPEEVAPAEVPVETAAVEKAEETRSWCTIM